MKIVDVENAINSCRSEGLTNEANLLDNFLKEMISVNEFAVKTNSELAKYPQFLKVGRTRMNVLEDIYQGSLGLLKDFKELETLE